MTHAAGNIMLRMTTSLIIMHMRPVGFPGTFSPSCFDLVLSVLFWQVRLQSLVTRANPAVKEVTRRSWTVNPSAISASETARQVRRTLRPSYLRKIHALSEPWALFAHRSDSSSAAAKIYFCLSQKVTWEWFRTARVPPRWSASVSLGSDVSPESHFQITAESVKSCRTQLVNTDKIELFNSVVSDLSS